MTDGNQQPRNPYEAPAPAPPPMPDRPRVGPWVLLGAAIGGIGFAVGEWRGWVPILTEMFPVGAGGGLIGLMCGGLVGRIVGRLLVARHALLAPGRRRDELLGELNERRGRDSSE